MSATGKRRTKMQLRASGSEAMVMLIRILRFFRQKLDRHPFNSKLKHVLIGREPIDNREHLRFIILNLNIQYKLYNMLLEVH